MAGKEQINLEKLGVLEPKILRQTPCCIKVFWVILHAISVDIMSEQM